MAGRRPNPVSRRDVKASQILVVMTGCTRRYDRRGRRGIFMAVAIGSLLGIVTDAMTIQQRDARPHYCFVRI
jgi:hypothetical protein